MLEFTIILDSNARNPFYIIFDVLPLFAQMIWVKRTRRRNPFTLGDTEKLKLNFAWAVRLFSLSRWCSNSCSLSSLSSPSVARAEHTTHCREEQHNNTNTHTHTREKRKLTKAMRMLLLMTHTAVVLALSLPLLLCYVLPNWKLARDDEDTDTTHSLATPRSAFALRECLHISNWYATPHAHARMISSSGRAKRNNRTHTKWSYDSTQNNKNKQQSRKQKQATIITDHPQSMA